MHTKLTNESCGSSFSDPVPIKIEKDIYERKVTGDFDEIEGTWQTILSFLQS